MSHSCPSFSSLSNSSPSVFLVRHFKVVHFHCHRNIQCFKKISAPSCLHNNCLIGPIRPILEISFHYEQLCDLRVSPLSTAVLWLLLLLLLQNDLYCVEWGVKLYSNQRMLLLLLLILLLLQLLQPFNGLFSRTTWVSRYQKGKNSPDLNEARYGEILGSSGISMQTICTSLLQTDNRINTSSLNCYRLDALPDAQPTLSKH